MVGIPLIRSAISAVFVAAAFAAPANSLPGLPTCPGNGNDTVAIGADGGWCDFMYMPPQPGTHVSCRWADFSFLIGDIGGHTECRIVDAQGNLAPGSPPWGVFEHWGDSERNPPPVAP